MCYARLALLNDNPNPAEHGRVARVLRTKVHSRGPRKAVRPVIKPMKTLDKSGVTQTAKGGQDDLGWTVVRRKPKPRKGKQQVVYGTYAQCFETVA